MNNNYKIWGGSITTIVLSLSVLGAWILDLENIVNVLAPVFYGILVVVSMSGSYVGFIIGIVVGAIINLGIYFAIGMFLGFVVEKIRYSKVLIALFILIIIFIAGGIIFLNTEPNYDNSSFSIEDCMSTSNTVRTDFDSNECIYSIAIRAQDSAICDKISLDSISPNRSECYSYIALQKNDYAICNKISDPNLVEEKNLCIEHVARGKGECNILTNSNARDYCYLYQAESIQQEVGDCSVFDEHKLKALCENYESGRITKADLCKEIKDEDMRQACLSR